MDMAIFIHEVLVILSAIILAFLFMWNEEIICNISFQVWKFILYGYVGTYIIHHSNTHVYHSLYLCILFFIFPMCLYLNAYKTFDRLMLECTDH